MKKFLIITNTFNIALLGLFMLYLLNLEIPLLRQLFSIVYLIFIPGFILLRFLKVHNLHPIENIIYTIGLSIFFVMAIGFLTNFYYSFIGIKYPLSTNILIITAVISLSLLNLGIYFFDNNFIPRNNFRCKYENKSLISILFLLLIPLLSIIGTYLVNNYRWNCLLLFIIVVISLTFIFTMCNKIPQKLNSLVIFSITISLLFINSLISSYIWGWDIFPEYDCSSFVYTNSYWDPANLSILNSVCSVSLFAPIFCKISGLSLTWFFKIVYPLLFSIVPLGLYEIYKRQTTEEIAFVGCFLLISTFSFYGEMLSLIRQGIAEIFFIALLFLFINDNLNPIPKNILKLIFSLSLIVSHYSTSYIFLFFVFLVFLLPPFFVCLLSLLNYVNNFLPNKEIYLNFDFSKGKDISINYFLFFFVVTVAWYLYTSGSVQFINFVQMWQGIFNSFIADFLSVESTQGLQLLVVKQVSLQHDLAKKITILTQIFIFFGFISALIYTKNKSSLRKYNFNSIYLCFAFGCLCLNIASLIIPRFALSLNFSRIYHLSLLLLAPFFAIGFYTFLNKFTIKRFNLPKYLILFILVPYFLLHSGFIFEITNDEPSSISLSNEKYNYLFIHESDLTCIDLFFKPDLLISKTETVYGDYFDILTLIAYSYAPNNQLIVLNPWDQIKRNDLLYVRSSNLYFNNSSQYQTYSYLFINNLAKIYDSNCRIYKML